MESALGKEESSSQSLTMPSGSIAKQSHPRTYPEAVSSQTIMENQNSTCNVKDTELAMEYFKKNNHQFPKKTYGVIESDKDEFMNTILYVENPAKRGHKDIRKISYYFIIELERRLRELAVAIEENTETFCQIELLVRKIPMEEVREYDIKLIVQYLRCFTIERIRWEFNNYCQDGNRIYMNGGTPLANLGYVAQLIVRDADDIVIVSTKATAAVCQLFVDLCHSVGLTAVKTVCVKSLENVDIPMYNMDITPALSTGCVGVVAERCDVAAAAGVFLRSTTRYPWKLSWIFVHETVFDEFTRAMVQQCSDKRDPVPAGLRAAAKCCKSAFQCDGKTFLADFAGDARSAAGAVLVNTYRSADEVVACVNVHRAMYLSLWTDDVSRAHEVALGVAASLVWVNCYAQFDGPPQASLAIFTEMTLARSDSSKTVPIVCSRETLLQKQENWEKTSLEERCRVVQNITDEFFSEFQSDDLFLFDSMERLHKNIIPALGEVRANDYFRVDDKNMCAVNSIPTKVIYRSNADVEDMLCTGVVTIPGAGELARLLTNGSALIFQQASEISDYLKRLATKLPITWHPRHYGEEKKRGKKVGKAHGQIEAYYTVANRTKVVWTKFCK